MSKYRELLLSMRKAFAELEPLDESGLNSLRDRGRMIIRRVFGEDSAYIEQLFDIEFHHPEPYMDLYGEPGPPADRGTERPEKAQARVAAAGPVPLPRGLGVTSRSRGLLGSCGAARCASGSAPSSPSPLSPPRRLDPDP
jgi:hypothetical protein